MDSTPEQRLELEIQGLVQGVGFRPRLYGLAQQLGLRGWVRNGGSGVEVRLEGPTPQLQRFLAELRQQPPPRCRIDQLHQHWGPAAGELTDFQIAPPAPQTGTLPGQGAPPTVALISPDLAICPDCLADLHNPHNRRYGYPLISCTNCGPRYSVVERLPFERHHTSLADFPLCPSCEREYADPSDRRFHAQTITCPSCGPQLRWQGNTGTAAACISAAVSALQNGQIVALQGLGGFQLLVDARNPTAVASLRRRKGRPEKPLALVATRAWVDEHCLLSPEEAATFEGPAAPILLLRRRRQGGTAVAVAVAPGSPWLGVMRPTSGLHQLLLESMGGVVVATSANRSGEPLCVDAGADAALLKQLADGVLSHGLRIVNRIDDSVVRVACQRPLVLRLGRGLAPCALPRTTRRQTLALGAQVKGNLALGLPGWWLLSPDLGDLGSSAGQQHLRHTLEQWRGRHGLRASAIGCDQHPGYASSQLAAALAEADELPLGRLQHHHAHLLAVMAEHGLEGSAMGVAWDGAGHGADGSLWGGECLRVNATGYQRLAHLRPFRLPGGEAALREPRRAALGLLIAAFGDQGPARWPAFSAEELRVLQRAMASQLNSPLCSSVGRLFDGVAALLGLPQRCSYEGQAAMALEALALDAPASTLAYPLPLRRSPGPEPWQLDWQPLLEELLRDQASGIAASVSALAFHRALAGAVAELATALQSRRFLLSGGCFQNQLLLELSTAALEQRGIEPLWPQQLPCNDGALAIGQLMGLNSTPASPRNPAYNRSSPQLASDVPGGTG
jgi:hydrogenase maturation protein HypF